MASRRPFGGTAPDFVWTAVAGAPRVAVTTVTFWTAETDGTKITDLIDQNGNPASQIITDASGRIPRFQGPDDDTNTMWADGGGGEARSQVFAADFTSYLQLGQLILIATDGFGGQIFEVFDELGNPIGSIGPTGGFNVFGDDNRVFPGGDVFDPINRLRSDGTVQQNSGDAAGSVGAVATGNQVSLPTTVPNGSTLLGGSLTTAGILHWASGGRSFRMLQSGVVQEDNLPTRRRVMSVFKDGGAATISSVGSPACVLDTSSGSNTTGDQALVAALIALTTGGTSGNTSGILPPGSSFAEIKPAWSPMFHAKIVTDPTAVTSVRYWVGLFSADPAAISSPTGIHAIGFRFDTAVDGTTWHTVTSAAGTPTVSATGVTVSTVTEYDLRIEVNAAYTAVRFFIRAAGSQIENLVATHTTGLPTFSQLMGRAIRCTALSASARAIQFSSSVLEHVG